ncbi:hypothetical protein GDO78_017887 [Eleutherodactylus coqui]|uniref:Uncharacterized protein n=1 Tax=Eleutherodactylus coqui TaxID=57060 RepID=A0A8J6BEF0_ELECQ|nr:hypothetical protein GDO78_017887 [Eleutherodactylus coqui]
MSRVQTRKSTSHFIHSNGGQFNSLISAVHPSVSAINKQLVIQGVRSYSAAPSLGHRCNGFPSSGAISSVVLYKDGPYRALFTYKRGLLALNY